MSECVVRMEMPKNCEMCHLRVNDSPTNVPNWICAINQWPTFYCKKSQNHANEDKYLHDCPIICTLPEGHGRLVSADKLKEWLIDQIDYYKRFDGPNCSIMVSAYEAVCQVINDFATIVPATEATERSET